MAIHKIQMYCFYGGQFDNEIDEEWANEFVLGFKVGFLNGPRLLCLKILDQYNSGTENE